MLALPAPTSTTEPPSTELAIWQPQHRHALWYQVVAALMPDKSGYYDFMSGCFVVNGGGPTVDAQEHDLEEMVTYTIL